jgi:hypothetical protein
MDQQGRFHHFLRLLLIEFSSNGIRKACLITGFPNRTQAAAITPSGSSDDARWHSKEVVETI